MRRQFLKDREEDVDGKENVENQAAVKKKKSQSAVCYNCAYVTRAHFVIYLFTLFYF